MFIDDILDVTGHGIFNFTVSPLSSLPTGVEGNLVSHTTDHRLKFFDGTAWKTVLFESDSTAFVNQASDSASAGILKVSQGANKDITDYTGGAGILKTDAAGVVVPAVAGDDYLTASSTNTLTNKTFDVAGTGNSLSNVAVSNLASGVLNTASDLAEATDAQIPSALAVKTSIETLKTYTDGLLAAHDVMTLKGSIDASSNPNYPAGAVGDVYKIGVAGRIGGASGPLVEAGDVLTCFVTGVAGTQAAVGGNWTIQQTNLDAATTTVAGFTRYATDAEVLAATVTNAAVTPSNLKGMSQEKVFLFGDGTALTFTLTHNLNNVNVVAQVTDASTGEVRYPKVVTSANTVVVSGYLVAPATNAMKLVVLGAQK